MALHDIYNTTRRAIGMSMINVGGRLVGGNGRQLEGNVNWSEMDTNTRYNLMWAYYRSNNLYEFVNELARQKGLLGWDAQPLRNPTHRCVEFHATHLWPGALPAALPLEGVSPIQGELEQLWKWSNWSQRKQVAARWFATFGDMFLKVATKEVIDTEAVNALHGQLAADGAEQQAYDAVAANPPTKVVRVYLQLIDPRHVTMIKKDHRGYFTHIRLDIPEESAADGKDWILTEIWDKYSYRMYRHDKGGSAEENTLEAYMTNSGLLEDIAPGMDFVPFTHAKFLDSGDERGWPCTWASIAKIDEANRQATRHSQLLFRHNKALWAVLSNRVGRNGEPMPAPSMRDTTTGQVPSWQDGDVLELPGAADIKSLSPEIDYNAGLASIAATMAEIEQDLPELRYSNLQAQANLAAETVVKFMAPALDRLAEARGNAETALIQAQEMALTIGAAHGLFPKIRTEGAYEVGELAHEFMGRALLATNSMDDAALGEQWVKSGLPLVSALREAGWSEEKISRIKKEIDADRKSKGASLTAALAAQRNSFEQGDQPGEPQDPARNNDPTSPVA